MPTAKGNLTQLERLLREGRRLGVPPNVAAMSEADLDRAALELANAWGWALSYHVTDSRVDRFARRAHRVDSGFPDRVWGHLRWGRVVVVELKDLLRPVLPHQANWLSVFAAAGLEVGVWRPADLEEMHAVFSNQARLRPPLRSAWRG
jgi:hypothetical protein